MASEKYIIRIETDSLALKFDLLKQQGTIGGLSRLSETMVRFVTNYFHVPYKGPNFIQQNKCRFIFRCPYQRFLDGLKMMREHSIFLESTTNLQNIMR